MSLCLFTCRPRNVVSMQAAMRRLRKCGCERSRTCIRIGLHCRSVVWSTWTSSRMHWGSVEGTPWSASPILSRTTPQPISTISFWSAGRSLALTISFLRRPWKFWQPSEKFNDWPHTVYCRHWAISSNGWQVKRPPWLPSTTPGMLPWPLRSSHWNLEFFALSSGIPQTTSPGSTSRTKCPGSWRKSIWQQRQASGSWAWEWTKVPQTWLWLPTVVEPTPRAQWCSTLCGIHFIGWIATWSCPTLSRPSPRLTKERRSKHWFKRQCCAHLFCGGWTTSHTTAPLIFKASRNCWKAFSLCQTRTDWQTMIDETCIMICISVNHTHSFIAHLWCLDVQIFNWLEWQILLIENEHVEHVLHDWMTEWLSNLVEGVCFEWLNDWMTDWLAKSTSACRRHRSLLSMPSSLALTWVWRFAPRRTWRRSSCPWWTKWSQLGSSWRQWRKADGLAGISAATTRSESSGQWGCCWPTNLETWIWMKNFVFGQRPSLVEWNWRCTAPLGALGWQPKCWSLEASLYGRGIPNSSKMWRRRTMASTELCRWLRTSGFRMSSSEILPKFWVMLSRSPKSTSTWLCQCSILELIRLATWTLLSISFTSMCWVFWRNELAAQARWTVVLKLTPACSLTMLSRHRGLLIWWWATGRRLCCWSRVKPTSWSLVTCESQFLLSWEWSSSFANKVSMTKPENFLSQSWWLSPIQNASKTSTVSSGMMPGWTSTSDKPLPRCNSAYWGVQLWSQEMSLTQLHSQRMSSREDGKGLGGASRGRSSSTPRPRNSPGSTLCCLARRSGKPSARTLCSAQALRGKLFGSIWSSICDKGGLHSVCIGWKMMFEVIFSFSCQLWEYQSAELNRKNSSVWTFSGMSVFHVLNFFPSCQVRVVRFYQSCSRLALLLVVLVLVLVLLRQALRQALR